MNDFWTDIEQFWAANDHWIWIALAALLVVIAISALIGFALAKKRDLDRKHADAIRTDANRQNARIGAKDAEARRLEAEADQLQAEADRLHAVARERRQQVERDRARNAARLSKAERLEHGRRFLGAHH
ncbi:hypothetical protein D0Z08_08400 [Nocardioides immobilis]|uniref:Uncharacterized protein n=1 Tax=Nocardioides immobilis TaxID=2049295 RepID=A0A417Y4S0_9ACTN|nr:hypothetical protein [Nocardioides immobilis]RHW27678.1 hypothetical protein D0Z08_08400 [Nocardioides immobilis]